MNLTTFANIYVKTDLFFTIFLFFSIFSNILVILLR